MSELEYRDKFYIVEVSKKDTENIVLEIEDETEADKKLAEYADKVEETKEAVYLYHVIDNVKYLHGYTFWRPRFDEVSGRWFSPPKEQGQYSNDPNKFIKRS